jgi:hypothetical protein
MENKEKFLGTLSRVQYDLLLFLACNPTQKPVWWSVKEIFEMLSRFFKNLCENNNMDFKNWLGSNAPKVADAQWNERGSTYFELFNSQLQHLLECSRLGENREAKMVHSDQYSRLSPLLLAVLNLLNEMISGPCEINQVSLMANPILEVYQIMTRLPDDLEHEYYALKEASLNLVFSITEGMTKSYMKEIALRLTPSILQNQIERLLKKLYIHELLRKESFSAKVLEAQ